MNEGESKTDQTEAGELSAERADGTTTATTPALPDSLDVNQLQALPAGEVEKLCRDLELRVYPGRSRHHLILDLVRAALGLGIRVTTTGFFDSVADGFGIIRWPRLNFLPVPEDVGVPRPVIQKFKFRPAQKIRGTVRLPRDREKMIMLDEVLEVEGIPAAEWSEPTGFDNLTPLYPQGRIMLENTTTNSISARAVDLLTPLGRGQRGLIVAAPRVGKTILLKEIAKAIRVNHPEIVLIILLVDERPEEVTDLQREVDCDVYNSTFDENSRRHVEVAELVLERAKRLVEQHKDVVVLLDSITRLARGYNSLQPGKGRTMSGGVEAKALLKPKKFFGAARNCEEGGSLTIVATALVDTGSKMDQVIFEEFKGTGNMELHLDRALVEKRLYPAIHCLQSATRREDLLYHPEEWERVQLLRKAMAALPPIEAMEKLIDNLNATKTNAELLLSGLR
ncbi:MAG TPA: transcription termination factor Rho [Chthoniobacterales bacterium]|jgi:transcription termination factor Rho|nr:transcription termination factor Rho [Chthoniobacterales bacterium]